MSRRRLLRAPPPALDRLRGVDVTPERVDVGAGIVAELGELAVCGFCLHSLRAGDVARWSGLHWTCTVHSERIAT